MAEYTETQVTPSGRQRGYFDLARRVSYRATGKSRHGSVLVNSGRVLNIGYNHDGPGPKGTRLGYWTVHSEVGACLALDRELTRGSVIYNWRETKEGRIADSCPCPLCQSVLRELGVRRVYYTKRDGTFGEMKL